MIGTVDKDGVKEGHSWNFVILDDEYYYTDICWDDLAPSSDNTDITYCYAFFNLTYEEMKKTHNFDMQTEYLYEVNDSNSKKYSFMKSNGLYAYTYEQACEIIKTNLPLVLDYNKSLMIQCDDEETYNKLSENITDIIKNVIKETNISIKHCRYIKIENGYTIIVHDFVS
jgi:hypothetical protein